MPLQPPPPISKRELATSRGQQSSPVTRPPYLPSDGEEKRGEENRGEKRRKGRGREKRVPNKMVAAVPGTTIHPNKTTNRVINTAVHFTLEHN